MLSLPAERGEVLTYELKNLQRGRMYTLAVFQIAKGAPVISQLTVNISNSRNGSVVFPTANLIGTKRGRKVFLELYEQPKTLRPPEGDRKSFSLPRLRDENGLVLLDKKSFLYIKDAGRTKKEKRDAYFQSLAALTDAEQRYCRCVLHVAAKNSRACNRGLREKAGSGACYNPYAVCSKRIPVGRVYCGAQYEWSRIPTEELVAYSDLNKLEVGTKPSRKGLIAAIRNMKAQESA